MENNKNICTVVSEQTGDTVDLLVYRPSSQKITLLKSELPFIISALKCPAEAPGKEDYSLKPMMVKILIVCPFLGFLNFLSAWASPI